MIADSFMDHCILLLISISLMYHILIAPDKFKSSLTSFEVCAAIKNGLLRASSGFKITCLPLADGGDGLFEIIAYYTGAREKNLIVQNPLFQPVNASWLLSADGKTAFVEMAKASGLQLLNRDQYNPLLTSSFGTGELIKAAIEAGAEKIILGIGGSATNDGGIGMAAALGYQFFDEKGSVLSPVGRNLSYIKHIDSRKKIDLKSVCFRIACDVKNLLFGSDGATNVYGPQKGATPAMVKELEAGMINYARVIQSNLGIDVSCIEGGGAAGGMGAGCVAFLNAELTRGINLVMQYAGVEEQMQQCNLVITGEGRIDAQTLHGKVVAGVAGLAKHHNKPLLAFCGSKATNTPDLLTAGITSVFSILPGPMSLNAAVEGAAGLLEDLAFNVGTMLARLNR